MVLEREKKKKVCVFEKSRTQCQKAWALMDFCVFSEAVRLRHTATVAELT